MNRSLAGLADRPENRVMKRPTLKSFVGSMIFLILAVPVFAGTLTITSGPTFTPDTGVYEQHDHSSGLQ